MVSGLVVKHKGGNLDACFFGRYAIIIQVAGSRHITYEFRSQHRDSVIGIIEYVKREMNEWTNELIWLNISHLL